MKKLVLILLVVFKFCNASFCQECSIENDLNITFEDKGGNDKTMNNQMDFRYRIIQTNLLPVAKKVYSKLVWSDTNSKISNYYWKLYKKIGSEFVEVPMPKISSDVYQIQSELFMEYGEKGDSIFDVYDIEKESLPPFKSDTLCFNLLKDNYSIDPGEYRFKIYFRIGNAYSINNKRRKISEIYYINSDWYYFRVPNKIVYVGNVNDPSGCSCETPVKSIIH